MTTPALPPGQRRVASAPRFGLPWNVGNVPAIDAAPALRLSGSEAVDIPLTDIALEPIDQVSDLHCVTTWSCVGMRWRGWRFRDVYDKLIVRSVQPGPHETRVIITGADGYTARLPLEDALADDVMLATHLDGDPLSLAHGAPLRFVAPQHYGYKNVKHVTSIALVDPALPFRAIAVPAMEHPRARVHLEERGRLPAALLRILYRPFIGLTAYLARRALTRSSTARARG